MRSARRTSTAGRTPRRLAGVTLIELMVALAIGSFLMIGAITVFMQSRTTFRVSESVARLQENGRFVLGAIEPDIRLASYFGLTSRGTRIAGRAGTLDPVAAIAPAGDCGPNWSIDLRNPIAGWNNRWGWDCTPYGNWVPQSDSVVIRHVAPEAETGPLDGDRLYVQSARFQEGQLFQGPDRPAGFLSSTSATHRLVVNGYYVSANSTLDTAGNPVPSLRRKTLQRMRIVDEEVMPGIEDLQVQLGIDTDPAEAPGRGVIDRYVSPGDPILDQGSPAYLPHANVLALRLWLRVRAERPEVGFSDDRTYAYADRTFTPTGADASFRRIVVSKTVYLRNARPPT